MSKWKVTQKIPNIPRILGTLKLKKYSWNHPNNEKVDVAF